jgi:hypothetical protein
MGVRLEEGAGAVERRVDAEVTRYVVAGSGPGIPAAVRIPARTPQFNRTNPVLQAEAEIGSPKPFEYSV